MGDFEGGVRDELRAPDRDAARRELDRALVLAPDSAEARALQKRFGG
jgi:hypothetical protein